MKPSQLVNHVIKPSLDWLELRLAGAGSEASVQMMLATSAIESHCGNYVRQLEDGPARGMWQMEPDTENDIYANYLQYHPELLHDIVELRGTTPEPLINNLMYACVMARLSYYRQRDPMPQLNDKDGMYAMYKKYYNSIHGASTHRKWNEAWDRFVKAVYHA